MTIKEYQDEAIKTAIYPEKYKIIYSAIGLSNEAGEVLGKIKKVMRDKEGVFDPKSKLDIGMELADCLWYCSALASDLGFSLDHLAELNLAKLKDRQERGVLQGSGDTR